MTAGKYFASRFASQGVNIVSGLAIGCDTAVHEGALLVGGATTAFLGGGLDEIYPRENEGMARRIVDNGGLLLSEYPIGMPGNKYTLVARDRLQAGLASATLVIQCSRHSGTMHASKATLSAGKPLLVVDYKSGVDPSRTEGNEYLKSIGAMGLSSEAFAASPEKYLGLVKGRR